MHKKVLSFPVIYEADSEGGYVASVPSLPGCHTQGETLEEAETNVRDAIELYLESFGDDQRDSKFPKRVLQGTVDVSV